MPAYVEALRRFVANSRRFGGSTHAVQEEFQFTALARLAAHAFRHSPFWGERLAACGWDPGKPFDRAALQRLPRLTRAEAQARYEDLKARPLDPALGKVVSVATSGSTGKPVTIDRVGVQALHYDTATILNHLWHRRDFLLKLAVVRTMTKTVHRQDWGHPMAALYRTGPSSGLSSADNTIESEYEWIEAEKPDYLITQPGRARAFARIAAERGGSAHRIKHLISVGETVSQELRRAVRESLGAEIKDVYSTRDAGYLALQCPEHDHYHVLADAVLIEVVDGAGRPAPAGQPGDVLVSILHSFAMPILRYEIGDIAALGGPCDCGLTLPVLSQLLGRSRSLARMPDGRLRYVQFPGSRFLKIAPVREYQLIQRGDALMEAKIECGIPLTAEHESQIAAMIQDCIGFPIAVKVTQVERLALSAEGKREEFVRMD